MDHRLVGSENSRPLRDYVFTKICFSNFFQFMLGLMDFSDIAIRCNRPNNCCQQNLKSFDQLLFSLALFYVFQIQRDLGPRCPKCAEMLLSSAFQGKQDSG